ncbi:MAG: tetratricopeptide repeat protein [Acidobacteria bacterium]|nr:tetratricopeptide repeat protein [Acidobacteriota bacterium]
MKVWHRYSLAILIIIALTILAYGDSAENEFVHDDNYQIVRNPLLRPDSAWHQLFTTDVWAYTAPSQRGVSNYYRPLQMLSYRWTAEIAGLSPRRFHQVNLAFHILASLAAFGLFLQLCHRPVLAFAAAMLFVLHPIHSEAIIWISALPELGCATFFFVSFFLFLIARTNLPPSSKKGIKNTKTAKWNRWLLFASVLAFAVALLWKEMALTLPLLVGSYVFLIHSKEFSNQSHRLKSALLSTWPYWTVVATYLGWRFAILGFISKEQHIWRLSPFEFLLNVIDLTAKYWWKLLWPTDLNAFYLFDPVVSVFEPRLLMALFGLVGILAWMLYGWKKYPLAVFSSLWIFITLIPVLNIGGVGSNVFTERYLYIPSLGFCLLVTVLFNQCMALFFRQHQTWAGALGLLFVTVPYAVQSANRNADWKDDFTFYSKTAEASPNSAAMQNSLAHVLREKKHNLDEAQRLSKKAISLAESESPPNHREIGMGCLNLANVFIEQGRFEAALKAAETGLQSDRTLSGLLVVKGIALYSLGRLSEANELFVQIYQQSPNDEIVVHLLGVIALSQRRLTTAVEYFTKALTILPTYRDAHNNLAAAYAELGRYQDALAHLQRAAQLNQNDPLAHTNLGIILSKLERIDEAQIEFRRAQALAPNDPAVGAQIEGLEGISHR